MKVAVTYENGEVFQHFGRLVSAVVLQHSLHFRWRLLICLIISNMLLVVYM